MLQGAVILLDHAADRPPQPRLDRILRQFGVRGALEHPCGFVRFDRFRHRSWISAGIKNKMTKDEFVKNNRGINDHQDSSPLGAFVHRSWCMLQDLPREYLEGLYDGTWTASDCADF